jgi:surface antigen
VALLAVVFLVVKSPSSDNNVHKSTAAAGAAPSAGPLDQLSSADIAVHVARMTSMPEAVAVTNQADSEATQLAITATETKVVAKPQVVATSLKSAKDIQTYTSVNGDTLSALASKFGVTSDSIRWSNGLSSEKIPAGKQLFIPPVSGVVYTVKAGDTVDSLAQKYSSSKDQILADNDAEVSGLKAGQRILIRGGIQPVARVASVAATTSYSGSFFGGTASYGYNGYDYGWCTWYVANKRLAAGAPMPTNLGNAATWAVRAAAYGLATGRRPQVGAAVVTSTSGAGHVAYVERINPDGTIWVSEMNSRGQVSIDNPAPAGGWGRVDFKLLTNPTAYSYVY